LLCPQIIKLYTIAPKAITSDEKEQRRLATEITALLAKIDTFRSDISTWTAELALQSPVPDINNLRAAQLKLEFLVSILISNLASASASSPLFYPLDYPVLHQQCYSHIHSLSLDILSHIPSDFRDPIPNSSVAETSKRGEGPWVEAVEILFPVVVLCRIPAIQQEQREKAIRILERIWMNKGIKFALDYASNLKTLMRKPFKPVLLE